MYRRCQAILIYPSHRRAGTSLMKIHIKSIICAKPPVLKKQGINQLPRDIVSIPLIIKKPYLYFNSLQLYTQISSLFDQSIFQQKILKFITTARLLFRIIENTSFISLLDYTRTTDSKLNIPSTRTIRRLLDTSVQTNSK